MKRITEDFLNAHLGDWILITNQYNSKQLIHVTEVIRVDDESCIWTKGAHTLLPHDSDSGHIVLHCSQDPLFDTNDAYKYYSIITETEAKNLISDTINHYNNLLFNTPNNDNN